jgi:hypothetical protein
MPTYKFGCVGDTNLEDGTYGLLQSFNKNQTGDEHIAKDADGNTAAVELNDDRVEITAEYLLDTTLTLPVRGDTIIIGATDKYLVTEVGEPESNSDFKKGTITLKRWTTNGIPANV